MLYLFFQMHLGFPRSLGEREFTFLNNANGMVPVMEVQQFQSDKSEKINIVKLSKVK